jgi:hypothetical protein
MPAKPILPLIVACLICLPQFTLGGLEVKSYKNDRDYITEGGMERVTWYPAGLATMTDYRNYNKWAVAGLDGNDPVSAEFWENFQDFQFQAPDIIVVKLSLNLPWPLGKTPAELKLRIDESQVANNQLTLNLIDRPTLIEAATLSLSGTESTEDPGTMDVHFRIMLRFDPVIELLLNMDNLNIHMRQVVGILAANLEAASLARSRQSTGDVLSK